MNEQVSVDKVEYEMLKKVLTAWNGLQNRQGKSESFSIMKSEYERLKRLDENVKIIYERVKNGMCGHDDWTHAEIIELLEDLGK